MVDKNKCDGSKEVLHQSERIASFEKITTGNWQSFDWKKATMACVKTHIYLDLMDTDETVLDFNGTAL